MLYARYTPQGGRSTPTNVEAELDDGFQLAVDLDDEHDRRHGLGEYAPADLTTCGLCGARHDFDECPVCAVAS